jgi:hypothetical protein
VTNPILASHLSSLAEDIGDAARVVDVTDKGVTGNGSTDDATALNAALTALEAAGGGVAFVPGSAQVRVTSKITVPPTVTLKMHPGADIIIDADVDGIELRGNRPSASTPSFGGGSRLVGGRVIVNQASYSKSAIVLDGDRTGGERFHRRGNAGMDRVILQARAGAPFGTAIKLKANATGSVAAALQWLSFLRLNIIGWENGIHFDVSEADSAFVGFINGNFFSHIFMEGCKNFLRFTLNKSGSGVADLSLNAFASIIAQATTVSEKFILVDGNNTDAAQRNHFLGMEVFDWDSAPAASATAVELASASNWRFTNVGGLDTSHFSMDESLGNFIVDDQLRLHGGSELPTLPGDFENQMRLWRNTANKKFGLVVSDGARWLPVVGTSPSREDFTVNTTFTTAMLCSRQLYGQSASAADNPTVFDIGTNASPGCEVHIQRRHATTPLRLDVGARVIYDNFAGTVSTSGQDLSLDSQFAEVILRCVENNNWAVVFKRGTLSYV